MSAAGNGFVEEVKLLLKQEGIDINAQDIVYCNNLMFKYNIWNLFKFFTTALMYAVLNGDVEIVQILLDQEGIDLNAENILLFYLKFVLIIFDFKIIFGNYLKHIGMLLFLLHKHVI